MTKNLKALGAVSAETPATSSHLGPPCPSQEAAGRDKPLEQQPPVRANSSLASGRRGLRIPAFCHTYGVGRTTAFRLLKEGQLTLYKVGRVTLIDADEAERWWRSCAKGQR